jgi:iron(III) transport system permease protein
MWSLGGLLGTLRFAILEVADNAIRGPLRDALVSGSWRNLQKAGRWFGDPFASPLVASLAWSAVAASGVVVLAWSLAWLSRGPGLWRWLTVAGVAVALATPGPVVGLALVLGYREFPRIYGSAAIVIFALIVRTFPYALLVLWPAVRSIPSQSLDAAIVDGCGPVSLLYRVAIPSTRGALLAAWCVAFVLGVGELPATNLVVPPGTPPISFVIWTLLHTGVESHLAGVALVMLAAIAATGVLAEWALRRVAQPSRRDA